jgi:hypothetical protein
MEHTYYKQTYYTKLELKPKSSFKVSCKKESGEYRLWKIEMSQLAVHNLLEECS